MDQPAATDTPVRSAEAESGLTVDDVARDAGIPTSTVRMYQNRGLLPPPQRRGRVGYYGDSHRSRLRLIAHLQERGFSLAAIKETLDSWAAGQSLDQMLGVTEVAPALRREPLRLTPSELAERFVGVGLTQADILRAVEIGLVELDGTDIVVSSAAFADIGPAVVSMGVPVDEILDEYEALSTAVGEIAERFRAVFERRVWEPFVERGMPVDEIPALTADVGRLTELATSVVTTELHQRFAAFATEFLDQADACLPDRE